VLSRDRDLWRERSVDLGLCVAVLAALVAVLITTKSTSDWITPFLQAVAAFGLLFRRSKPVTVATLMVLGALPLLAEDTWPGLLPNVDQEGVWVPLATPIACYGLIVYGTDMVVAALFIGTLTLIGTRPWAPPRRFPTGPREPNGSSICSPSRRGRTNGPGSRWRCTT